MPFDPNEASREIHLSLWELEILMQALQVLPMAGDERHIRALTLSSKLAASRDKFQTNDAPSQRPDLNEVLKDTNQGPASKAALKKKR